MAQSSENKLPDFILKMHELCAPYGDLMDAHQAIMHMETIIEKFYAKEKEIIRQARQYLNLSLDDVADLYCIKKEKLERIESPDHYFPNQEYIQLWIVYGLVYATRQTEDFDYNILKLDS